MRYNNIKNLIKNNAAHSFEALSKDEILGHLYDEGSHPELKNVLLFGDNFTGDAVGFLTTDNWAIVEVWHDDNLSINPREENTSEEFVINMFSH